MNKLQNFMSEEEIRNINKDFPAIEKLSRHAIITLVDIVAAGDIEAR